MPEKIKMWIKKMFFSYIALKDAAKIAYLIMNFQDDELVTIPPIEKNNVNDILDDLFAERDKDSLYLQKQKIQNLEFREKGIVNLIGQYINNKKLDLYGEKPPSFRREKIPLEEIKNWNNDFSILYKDDSFSKTFGKGIPIINYKNIRIKTKEFRNILKEYKKK